MKNKEFIQNCLARLKIKEPKGVSVIESVHIDNRRNPNMRYSVLSLSDDMLYTAKLNQKFLEEEFIPIVS